MRRLFTKGAIVVVALLAMVLAAGWYISGPMGSPELKIAVTEQDGSVKDLPFVDGGDPANPISGSEADNDPRTPPVYGGQITKSWTELDALLGAQTSYTDCMDRTLGMKWKNDVPRFKTTEKDGYRTTFITAVMTTASDEEVRKIAKRDDPTVTDKTLIIRKDMGFVNTRGIEDGGCEEFVDIRSVIRTSHGIVRYKADGTPEGLLNDRGIFATCKNGWRFVKTIGPKPTQPGGTTVVTTTTGTTTPKCEGPCTTTTTNPPDCTQPCGKEQKISEQGSDPQGNAPVGGSTKDQPGPDVRQPHTPNPTPPYTAPTQPTQANPPPGSTPTQIQPPPVETSVNPPSSQPNQGDPGEW